ncbi:TniQ family protein [Streptomyces sp. NPDC102384]|uniref:TniQ family protein n=1 Tax=unclassified Streptomyces TaxID=2593676 RepID=UPI0038149075
MKPRPLPRSLAPVVGESLASFLLRLSFRLSIKPLDLAERCGILSARTTFASRQLVQLDHGTTESLARSCRLSITEINNMTLVRQAPGFPPLEPNYLGKPRTFATMVAEGWVFTRFSRYCPECLADSGATSVPDSFWPGIWRLPMVFSCHRHRRYLEAHCPACSNPAFSAGFSASGRWRTAKLIPNPVVVLHPGQCRSRLEGHDQPARQSSACGYRLDHSTSPAVRPEPEVVRLQEQLLRMATSRHSDRTPPAEAGTPSEQFNDLRTAMLLICGTWPTAAKLFPRTESLDVIDADLERRQRALATQREIGQLAHTVRALDAPPRDAVAAASLMLLAKRALTSPDAPEILNVLLAQCTKQWPARTKLLQLEPHCSTRFRKAVRAGLAPLHPEEAGHLAAFPQTATHYGKLSAATIPQRLPDAWMAQLGELGAPIRDLRRDAAIRLVQMAHGGTRRQAALYLGFGTALSTNTTVGLRAWQKAADNARSYERALAQLADEIAANGPFIDYEHRRTRLGHWLIPEDEWVEIIEAVTQQQTPRVRGCTRWDEIRHLAASTVVWAAATQGEYIWAPMLRAWERTARTETIRFNNTFRELLPGPMHDRGFLPGILSRALHECTNRLTGQLDAEHDSGSVGRRVVLRQARQLKAGSRLER